MRYLVLFVLWIAICFSTAWAFDEDPVELWKRLPEVKKRELMERFQYFKSLPESERKNLKERHRKLKVIRESLDTEESSPVQEPNHRVKKMFKEREEALRKLLKIPPEEPLEANAGYLKKRLEQMNQQRFDKFLNKLVKEGILEERHAKRIRSLPESERKAKAFELGKKRFLKEMEGLIPEEEAESLKKMEPWHFHRKMRGERERRGMAGPPGRLNMLTLKQKEALEAVPEGPERMRMQREFCDENLRKRLEMMGVARETVERVLSMPTHERQRWIMKKLRSLKDNPDGMPPEIRNLLKNPSRERTHRRGGNDQRSHRERKN